MMISSEQPVSTHIAATSSNAPPGSGPSVACFKAFFQLKILSSVEKGNRITRKMRRMRGATIDKGVAFPARW